MVDQFGQMGKLIWSRQHTFAGVLVNKNSIAFCYLLKITYKTLAIETNNPVLIYQKKKKTQLCPCFCINNAFNAIMRLFWAEGYLTRLTVCFYLDIARAW